MHNTSKPQPGAEVGNRNGAPSPELFSAERGGLLSGLVIDAAGSEMIPSRATAARTANSRYYVSTSVSFGRNTEERIPSSRLDTSVVAILGRIHLLNADWNREQLLSVLRRVVVLENAVILHLDKRRCLAIWRASEPMLQNISTGGILHVIETSLEKDEELGEAGTSLSLKVPRHSRARKIRPRSRANALFEKMAH